MLVGLCTGKTCAYKCLPNQCLPPIDCFMVCINLYRYPTYKIGCSTLKVQNDTMLKCNQMLKLRGSTILLNALTVTPP